MTTTAYKTIYTFDYAAWEIHNKTNGTIGTNLDYHPDHAELAEAAIGENPDHLEDWSDEITELDPIHTALRVGDALYCQGYGSPVYVLRKDS